VAPVTGGRAVPQAHSEIDSKLQIRGPGPKMISFTLPAFGLVVATIAIGFACTFVIGRMTTAPAQAANVEAAEIAAPPIDPLTLAADPFDMGPQLITPPVPADTMVSGGVPATPAAATPQNQAVWGFQVIQYKAADAGLATTFKASLEGKGFEEVYVINHADGTRVIVGANPSYQALVKAWKQNLTTKGYRADPVKFNPAEAAH